MINGRTMLLLLVSGPTSVDLVKWAADRLCTLSFIYVFSSFLFILLFVWLLTGSCTVRFFFFFFIHVAWSSVFIFHRIISLPPTPTHTPPRARYLRNTEQAGLIVMHWVLRMDGQYREGEVGRRGGGGGRGVRKLNGRVNAIVHMCMLAFLPICLSACLYASPAPCMTCMMIASHPPFLGSPPSPPPNSLDPLPPPTLIPWIPSPLPPPCNSMISWVIARGRGEGGGGWRGSCTFDP